MSFTPTRRLQVRLSSGDQVRPVGSLALVNRRILFEFEAEFQAAPLPLSPLHLKVTGGVHEEKKRIFKGLFGVFHDSLPDGWGRLLLDRSLAQRGIPRERLTPLDRLAVVGVTGMGALSYAPAHPAEEVPSVIDLRALAAESRRVLEGEASEIFPELLALGGSSGGARPKVLLDICPDDGALSVGRDAPLPGYFPAIVKFATRDDPADVGAIEIAYADMARASGVEIAPTWLLGGDAKHPGYFATQRFDRAGAARIHSHSLAGLLHATHRFPSTDYETLLKVTRWITRDQRAVEQSYRRAAFNVAAHNRDDHSKNFGFLMDAAGRWRLAPAFDLTFSTGPAGQHWMTIGGRGDGLSREDLLGLAKGVGIPSSSAQAILDEVRDGVACWDQLASQRGVTRASRRQVHSALETAVGRLAP